MSDVKETELSPAHHALMNYSQADMDGIIVEVSRQAIHEVSDELTRLQAERDEALALLEQIRKSAVLLQQNAEGCAVNHYQGDFEQQGLPGWLADTQADINKCTALLARIADNK